MTNRSIEFRGIEEFNQKHSDKGNFAFEVKTRDLWLGYLYLDPEYTSFAWPGNIDYSKLEAEALKCLALAKSNGAKPMSPDSLRRTVSLQASFILFEDVEEKGALNEYQLNDVKQVAEYEQDLQNHGRIGFARWDFNPAYSQLHSEIAFTAENPKYRDDPELTVALTKPNLWSARLVKWMFEHHVDYDELRGKISPKRFARALNGFTVISK